MKSTLASKVNLSKMPDLLSGELSEVFIRHCCFCGKKCESAQQNGSLLERMSGEEGFYCPFCIRNNYQNKGSRDVLILSFRAAIGYLYYNNYLMGLPKKMWLAEVRRHIDSHRDTGLQNPLFVYDERTMLWFVDFARIGDSGRRQPLDDVHRTVVNILACFNLYETVPDLVVPSLFKKFRDSIDAFHARRYRPENRRMLIPTFNKCGIEEGKSLHDKYRSFNLDVIQNVKII